MFEKDDICQFQEDGFLIVHNFFDANQVNLLKQNWSNAQESIKFGDDALQRVDRFILGILTGDLGKLYKDDSLVAAAKCLLQEEHIALYANRMLIKDDRWNGAVAMHQDITSFHGTLKKLSAFVPLQTHNEATGGLKVVKGSHHYGNFGIQGTIFSEKFPEMEVVIPALEVGDVLFMDFLTWHYSEEAQVKSDRPLMQIIYQSSRDGSYYELAEPTLVAGQWQTEYFLPYGYGTSRNTVAPGEEKLVHDRDAEIAQLKAQLEQVQTQYQNCVSQSEEVASQLQHFQNVAVQTQAKIEALESSKFLKLRSIWLRLKQSVGL